MKKYVPGDSGLVCINKPLEWTSHDVVAWVRKKFGTKKVGHAGTLDPLATGLLLVGLGRATKVLGYLSAANKTYSTVIRLGQGTPTDDRGSEISQVAEPEKLAAVTEEHIHACASQLTGRLWQRPAAVSAVKVAGKKAYELVRQGREVELEARQVTVHDFTILSITRTVVLGQPVIDVAATISCSSGTYIRALARDMGSSLEVFGHVVALHRECIDRFTDMVDLQDLEKEPRVHYSLDDALQYFFPVHTISAEEAIALSHGRTIPSCGLEETYCAVSQGRAVALLKEKDDTAKALFLAQVPS